MTRSRSSDHHRPYIDLLDRVAVFAQRDTIAYQRIRARLDEIRAWFAERTGWPVIYTRDLIRLIKTPALLSSGHGFRWAQSPFDYALFTWTLWFAEANGDDQFLLSQLIEEIEVRANELDGPGAIDWDVHLHRLALNRALRGLEEMGALQRVHGDTDTWAQSGSGDSLYEFTPLVRYLSLELPGTLIGSAMNGGQVAAASITGPMDDGLGLGHSGGESAAPPAPDSSAAIEAQVAPDGKGEGPSPQSTVAPLHRLYRTLLLSPALYRTADPEAFALLSKERIERIGADLQNRIGWDLEVTDTYAALLRPNGSEASDQALFPFRGALSQVILLLCGHLREQVQSGRLSADSYDRDRKSVV